MPKKRTDAEFIKSFWSRVNKDGPTQAHMDTPCWEWVGAKYPGGYGAVVHHRKQMRAHRVAYALMCGPIPDELCVLHHCDNRSCVRHVYVGTKKQNYADMRERGREVKASGDRNGSRARRETRPRGESHGLTTLTAEQVLQLRRDYAAGGVTFKELGARHGLRHSTVHRIVRGKTWGHLPIE